MAKGFNSILFDFSSILDPEITAINWMRDEFRDIALDNFDKHKLLYTSLDSMKFHRVYGVEDVFSSMIVNSEMKENWVTTLSSIYKEYENEILKKKYACLTQMCVLINAYKKAGDGIIKTAVRCSNEAQKNFIKEILPDAYIEFGNPDEIDMSKYGRLICGNYKIALMYKLNEPKSVLILNFRENFIENDITKLQPELIISLGDIHDIQIISAFSEEINDPKG